MKKSVGWTSLRLTIRLLNLKRPLLNRALQVLTGHCNLQRHKITTGRAESSLCPNCSLEDETINHHVGNRKLDQDFVLNILKSPKPLLTMWQQNVTLTNWPRTKRKLEGFLSSISNQTNQQ